MMSLIIRTGQHMKVTVGIYYSMLGVNIWGFCSHLRCLIHNYFFVFAAQDQRHIYPSHSYNTSDNPTPPVAALKQDDYAGSRKNGTQEHSVVNFPTATSDTITIHSGKAKKSSKFVSFLQVDFWMTCAKLFAKKLACFCGFPASSPRKLYDTRDTTHSSVTQIDFDDDKYRRRPALSWFAQILK